MKSIAFYNIMFFYSSFCLSQTLNNAGKIAEGQMPSITKDKKNTVHMAYGRGDTIFYTSSADGKSFRRPSLVAVLPKLYSFAMRGPQISATDNGLIITACTEPGDIFAFTKEGKGGWSKPVRINEEKETAKEALASLSSDGMIAYAVWLGIRTPKGQNVIGARSLDGGKTWSKNILVYTSPDSTVCECCKPSVIIKGNKVFVMFRNWLNGNRDMYVIESTNRGNSFRSAQKLGIGSWKLNGCPMDGGGIVLNNIGIPQGIFRREGKIFTAAPGKPEKQLGEGRNGSIEQIKNRNVYAWTENGNVVVLKPDGKKINLGKGTLPLLKTLNNDQLICVWENDKKIYGAVIAL